MKRYAKGTEVEMIECEGMRGIIINYAYVKMGTKYHFRYVIQVTGFGETEAFIKTDEGEIPFPYDIPDKSVYEWMFGPEQIRPVYN